MSNPELEFRLRELAGSTSLPLTAGQKQLTLMAADELQAQAELICLLKARMQILRERMRLQAWDSFMLAHPEAATWFDEDGVPTNLPN